MFAVHMFICYKNKLLLALYGIGEVEFLSFGTPLRDMPGIQVIWRFTVE